MATIERDYQKHKTLFKRVLWLDSQGFPDVDALFPCIERNRISQQQCGTFAKFFIIKSCKTRV